eukprot:1972844-Prymnesium_polylepis.1
MELGRGDARAARSRVVERRARAIARADWWRTRAAAAAGHGDAARRADGSAVLRAHRPAAGAARARVAAPPAEVERAGVGRRHEHPAHQVAPPLRPRVQPDAQLQPALRQLPQRLAAASVRVRPERHVRMPPLVYGRRLLDAQGIARALPHRRARRAARPAALPARPP